LFVSTYYAQILHEINVVHTKMISSLLVSKK
jgi:hypothetical protein